ncbi:MAG: sugar phosphate isomerase/epimerase [Ardenticatenaceae bacterium]|nr:sugar phosphate isomerase/epimerase [Ardenticatenaceae bacterium]HBY98294.1 xylose isomerase [Chloroflexota bacterium]
MWRFAVQASLVPGTSFREQFELLARWGYDGIEVSGADLLHHTGELRQAMQESPVTVTSACAGFEGWLVDRNPRARNLAIAQIKAMLAAGAELATAGLISPAAYGIDSRGVLPPYRSAFTLEEDRALLIDSLRQIVESAERTGGTLLLEPLNRYVDRVLNSLEEAVSVIEEIGSPVIRLIPDFFHMNIEEADIAASLRRHAAHIGHVHLSDSNRLLPGRGHIDFASGFAALRDAGYDGAFAIECRVTGDPEELLPQALAFLRRAASQTPATGP